VERKVARHAGITAMEIERLDESQAKALLAEIRSRPCGANPRIAEELLGGSDKAPYIPCKALPGSSKAR